MTHGHLARSLLRRSDLEKTALLLRAGERLGKFVLRAGRNNPGTTALTVGATTAFGPSLVADAVRPDQASINRKAERRMYAQTLRKASMKKVASVLPSREDLEEALRIREGLEKQAAAGPARNAFRKIDAMLGDPARMFAAGAMLSAGAAAGGGAALGVGHLIGKGTEAAHRMGRERQFKAMVSADPSLKQSPQARAYFEVLHRASPYIASEPHVAAATVRSMLESPEGYALHPKFVRDLLDIEEKRQKTRYPSLRGPSLRGELPDMD